MTDIGRPVGHIVSNLVDYDNLVADVKEVLKSLIPREIEVTTREGVPYTMRIQPYRTLDNAIEGAVISFVDISELKQTQASLQQALDENRTILEELKHRAKNSFAMISSMINLAGRDKGPEGVETVLTDLSSRVRSISELYALLHATGSFREVRLDEYCARVAEPLVELAGRVSLESSFEEISVPIAAGAPVGMILTELLINAIKYAFPGEGGGTITVVLEKTDNGARLEVADDGAGLPRGFDPSAASGIGLNLVQALANQVGGTFTIDKASRGLRCSLAFPLEDN